MKLTIAHCTTATLLFTAVACGGSQPEPETPGEKAGEAIEDVGEEIKEAGDELEDESE